jgi:hypothetical protein
LRVLIQTWGDHDLQATAEALGLDEVDQMHHEVQRKQAP